MSETKPKLNGHRKSSCPDGWMPAGYSVPIRLTARQEIYCRRAIGINRFVYNLCVATHRFCRTNRLTWPSWQDIYKTFNACKHEDYPFATEVASRVAEGAFMDFGTAVRTGAIPITGRALRASGRGTALVQGLSGRHQASCRYDPMVSAEYVCRGSAP